MSRAGLALVLHAHLPWVRHPEHEDFLEEDWLYEALSETYIPLLASFEGLADELPGAWGLTVSLTPTLAAMTVDPLLRQRYARRLDLICELAARDVSLVPTELRPAAAHHREHYAAVRSWWQVCDGDLLGRWRALAERGHLDLITSSATHAILPLVQEPLVRRAQLRLARQCHSRWFGRPPSGLWLPECAYAEGIDRLARGEGAAYTILDGHGLQHGAPPVDLYGPARTPAGLAILGRDSASSRQVWSATDGYPGDPAYREFYRDRGYDLPEHELGPLRRSDGLRRPIGLKPFRVTGPVGLGDKQPYEPAAARARATEHARDFWAARRAQAAQLAEGRAAPPLIVAPYDAELFGHWWHEGPWFLAELIRAAAREPDALALVRCDQWLDEYGGALPETVPGPSSWGYEGYFDVWLNGSNAWIYRHTGLAEQRLVALCRHLPQAEGETRAAIDQAVRELLLAQGSDWAFIMAGGTTVPYATRRVREHLDNFFWLEGMLWAGRPLGPRLAAMQARTTLFPELDYRALFLA